MKRSTLTLYYLFLALGVIALAWSVHHWYQLSLGALAEPSFCNLNSYWNCDKATLSAYGSVFGLPIGVFGLLYLVLLGLLPFTKSMTPRRIFLFFIPGWAVSIFLLYVLLAVLGAGCVVCFVSYLSLFGAGLTALFLGSGGPKLSCKLSLGVFAGAVALVALYVLNQHQRYQEMAEGQEVDRFLEIFMNTPPAQLDMESPLYFGNADAPIRVFEFSDFGCPVCARAATVLAPYLEAQEDVRVDFFPLPLDQDCHPDIQRQVHPYSCQWSRAVLCAQSQSNWKPVYKMAFGVARSQGGLEAVGEYREELARAGYEVDDLFACMESNETESRLSSLIESARKLNVTGTPTFFVEGRRIGGLYPPPIFRRIINELRQ